MEMAADRLYKEKKIRGFCHLSVGQEAVAVGIEHAIERADHLITAYRCHGFAMMRGGTVKSIIGELLGRREGIAYGKGGSMHMFNKARHFHGGHGIVGAHVPLAAGMAFACKYRNDGRVVICLLGDGAVPNGGFHEAANMAGIWKLPLILCVENNMYAMGTPLERSQAILDIHKRAQSYNMHDILIVDGLNAEDVYDALPGGWQGRIDERGRGLSGGQRQRVVLARALGVDAPVLVLVEPTSAVDAHTEARIAERVTRLRAARTTVVCTVSPLWLHHADRVVLLDGGRVVTEGRHEDLLAGDPAYRAVVARAMDEQVVR